MKKNLTLRSSVNVEGTSYNKPMYIYLNFVTLLFLSVGCLVHLLLGKGQLVVGWMYINVTLVSNQIKLFPRPVLLPVGL